MPDYLLNHQFPIGDVSSFIVVSQYINRAWFMAQRIRCAMSEKPLSSKLSGIVEIDETYVGGKRRFSTPHAVKRGDRPKDRLGPVADKAAVVPVLQRGGCVQSRHVERVTAHTLKPILNQMASEEARIMADSSTVLKSVGRGRELHRVNHRAKEYVRYEDGLCVTTNTLVRHHEHC